MIFKGFLNQLTELNCYFPKVTPMSKKTEDPTHRLAHCNEKVISLNHHVTIRLIFIEKYNKQVVLFNIL